MKQNVVGLISCILLTMSLGCSPCFAVEVIGGLTSTFNAKTGELVLLTSEGQVTVYLPQTVGISVKPRLATQPVPADWTFLRNNLIEGTRVSIELLDKLVTNIVILEVPQ